MKSFLAYLILGILLVIQTGLMWRLNSKMGQEKCGFIAGVITLGCAMVQLAMVLFILGLERSGSMYGAWLFFGNWLAYKGLAFAHVKEEIRFTRYDFYSLLLSLGVIAFFYVLSVKG